MAKIKISDSEAEILRSAAGSPAFAKEINQRTTVEPREIDSLVVLLAEKNLLYKTVAGWKTTRKGLQVLKESGN